MASDSGSREVAGTSRGSSLLSREDRMPRMTSTGKKHSLLIVDDEPEVLAGLRGMFRRQYRVFTVPRALEALELLQREEIHVVVTDQRMPDMSGTDFLARVSEEFPNIVRLMITGYADIDSVIDAINRGHVYRYISKPWDPAELESAVRQAADQYDLMAERRRLLKELQEANQLKTAFITIASHELNTPLTIVIGMLQLALAKNNEPNVESYLERSLKGARRLQGLLSNTFKLLQQREFHRSLDRTAIRCIELFTDIAEDLEPYLGERHQLLTIKVEPPDLEFQASRMHFHDVLENLVTNAIKFSPDGTEISLTAHRTDQHVVLEVSDNGVGIPPLDQPHVFEPLFSTWDTLHHSTGDYGFCKRGIGLGLAIVKHFVEMHGGKVDFESQENAGTTFRIQLPID